MDLGGSEPGPIEVAVGRVEVEHQPIGMLEVMGSKAGNVEGDRVLVGEVDAVLRDPRWRDS